MSIKFKTEDLMKVVSQLEKVSPSKLLEITAYWNILGVEDEVLFTAYDGSNFIRVSLPVKGEIDVMVRADQFGKLVNKTTSESMKLTPTEESLKVEGNGEYFIEIVQEDEEYPSFDEMLPEELSEENAQVLKTELFYGVANINESAVSKSGADGIYTGYLFNDGTAVTTDTIRVCINPNAKVSENMLVPSALMDVLASLSDERMYLWLLEDDMIYATTSSVEVFGRLMEGKDDYVDVTALNELEYDGKVSLPTANIQSILDRLTLFMNSYDKGTVTFDFGKSNLKIITTTNSFESVKYGTETKKKDVKDFKCNLNSILLRDIISTVSSDYFTLNYGSDAAIKIEANGVTYFLALQEEE